MTTPMAVKRILAASLPALCAGLCLATTTCADPGQQEQPAPGPAAASVPADGDLAGPAAVACRHFAAAVRVSSAYYNTFAYSIAGSGAHVDYRDSTVSGDNIAGRTALRRAAGEALDAAATPGLQSEIVNPMRSWSWHAAKLALVMGLRGNGDTLNTAATELNVAADDAHMACANAGAQPVMGRHG